MASTRILNPVFLIKITKEETIMAEEDYASQMMLSEFNTKLRDLEEKQRLLKERVLIIGQNLIETRDELRAELNGLKQEVSAMKQEQEKVKNAMLRLSEELEKKARKSELEILERQFQMFSPLEFARVEDVKNMLGR